MATSGNYYCSPLQICARIVKMYCSRLFCSIKFVLQKIIITEDSMGWTQSVKVSVEFSAACWFLEASATKRQLVLSWHSLRCANHPFYACALDSWQLSFFDFSNLLPLACSFLFCVVPVCLYLLPLFVWQTQFFVGKYGCQRFRCFFLFLF